MKNERESRDAELEPEGGSCPWPGGGVPTIHGGGIIVIVVIIIVSMACRWGIIVKHQVPQAFKGRGVDLLYVSVTPVFT